MRRPLLLAALSGSLLPFATAQTSDCTFDLGSNPDGWVAWDSAYSGVAASGGAPFEQLVLDNVGGSSTCQYVFIEPTGPGPFTHSGDWRAAGIERVSVDLEIRTGPGGGVFCIFLGDDAGTPNDRSDDCYLVYIHTEAPQAQSGWQHYEFDVPAADTLAPADWFLGGACSAGNVDTRWNQIVEDVDYMFFVLDAAPNTGCNATFWDLGVDNINVQDSSLGSVYCAGETNSTGTHADLMANGSPAIADNDFTLRVESAPPLTFGIFVMSESVARSPLFGGTLCVGAPITRFLDIEFADATGTLERAVDLTALPGPTTFLPGDTWNFQYWHRDVLVSAPANLSDALSVTWE